MLGIPEASGSYDAGVLSIALIGPNEEHRKAVALILEGCQGAAVQEFSSYPTGPDELSQLLRQNHDVLIVDLDSDSKLAFDIVERFCADSSTSVMVYSTQTGLDLALHYIRAGACDFLPLPLTHDDMAGALSRLWARRTAAPQTRIASRKLFVFLGAKGGCGVTTIASNFAIALAQESGQSTLLIDFGLPLGDAAINLGMIAEYSTANALEDSSRMDANFLRALLTRHNSGLAVLPAPTEFSHTHATVVAIDKLLTVASQCFENVVVDAGSRVDLMDTALFEVSAYIYLIAQVGVSELRNANRLITQFFSSHGRKLQIVLNRYTPHALLFDDQQIAKALTRSIQWKIPDDYASARRTRNTATPIALEDTPISNVIRQMARTACGLPAHLDKKKGFSLFGRKKEPWPESKTLLEAEQEEA